MVGNIGTASDAEVWKTLRHWLVPFVFYCCGYGDKRKNTPPLILHWVGVWNQLPDLMRLISVMFFSKLQIMLDGSDTGAEGLRFWYWGK